MRSKLNFILTKILGAIELVIALLITVAVLLGIINLIVSTGFFRGERLENIDFASFLSNTLSLVIGIEFTRMLIKHSADAVIEVLLFAIARQLVTTHTATWESLIGIVAIALVFAIRKYLFVSDFQVSDLFIFHASKPIAQVNRIAHISLPDSGGETIGSYMEGRLAALSRPLEEGARVTIGHVNLRIATMKGDVIDTVNILKKTDSADI